MNESSCRGLARRREHRPRAARRRVRRRPDGRGRRASRALRPTAAVQGASCRATSTKPTWPWSTPTRSSTWSGGWARAPSRSRRPAPLVLDDGAHLRPDGIVLATGARALVSRHRGLEGITPAHARRRARATGDARRRRARRGDRRAASSVPRSPPPRAGWVRRDGGRPRGAHARWRSRSARRWAPPSAACTVTTACVRAGDGRRLRGRAVGERPSSSPTAAARGRRRRRRYRCGPAVAGCDGSGLTVDDGVRLRRARRHRHGRASWPSATARPGTTSAAATAPRIEHWTARPSTPPSPPRPCSAPSPGAGLRAPYFWSDHYGCPAPVRRLAGRGRRRDDRGGHAGGATIPRGLPPRRGLVGVLGSTRPLRSPAGAGRSTAPRCPLPRDASIHPTTTTAEIRAMTDDRLPRRR